MRLVLGTSLKRETQSTPHPQGARFNAATVEVLYRGENIADVPAITVDAATEFFEDDRTITRSLAALQAVGLGYLRLGQPATELSGGEAQQMELAAELQRVSRGGTPYIVDEPTTGLHPPRMWRR